MTLLWLSDGGIGHVLASHDPSRTLTYVTACGIATNKGRVAEVRPHSICGRCRRELMQAGIRIDDGKARKEPA